MKKKLIFFIFLFCVFLIPQKTFATEYNLEKIFYLAKYNAESGIKSVEQNWQKIDILAPQMYAINSKFELAGGFGPKLKKTLQNHKLKVMPLVANSNFSQKTIHNLLVSDTAQNKVINILIKEALAKKFIGWQFDFENINYLDKDLYTAFVEKTYKSFQKNNLILSIAVIARSGDYENTDAFLNWGGVYDYKKIASSTDFMSLMAYDDPNSIGPAASVDFVNKILSYVKDKIPPEKLSLGVPLYYWKWNSDTNKKVGSGFFKNVLAIASNFRHIINFDKSLGVSSLSYSYNNKNYKIWFEDKSSFKAKLNIIKQNNLRGFSAWLLGGEDSAIWNSF